MSYQYHARGLRQRMTVPQWAKSPKSSLYECIFDKMAQYFECRINENTLFQTVFLAIFNPFCLVVYQGRVTKKFIS